MGSILSSSDAIVDLLRENFHDLLQVSVYSKDIFRIRFLIHHPVISNDLNKGEFMLMALDAGLVDVNLPRILFSSPRYEAIRKEFYRIQYQALENVNDDEFWFQTANYGPALLKDLLYQSRYTEFENLISMKEFTSGVNAADLLELAFSPVMPEKALDYLFTNAYYMTIIETFSNGLNFGVTISRVFSFYHIWGLEPPIHILGKLFSRACELPYEILVSNFPIIYLDLDDILRVASLIKSSGLKNRLLTTSDFLIRLEDEVLTDEFVIMDVQDNEILEILWRAVKKESLVYPYLYRLLQIIVN
jgi:hypothetical protein